MQFGRAPHAPIPSLIAKCNSQRSTCTCNFGSLWLCWFWRNPEPGNGGNQWIHVIGPFLIRPNALPENKSRRAKITLDGESLPRVLPGWYFFSSRRSVLFLSMPMILLRLPHGGTPHPQSRTKKKNLTFPLQGCHRIATSIPTPRTNQGSIPPLIPQPEILQLDECFRFQVGSAPTSIQCSHLRLNCREPPHITGIGSRRASAQLGGGESKDRAETMGTFCRWSVSFPYHR